MVRQANIDDGVNDGMPLAEQADVVPALRTVDWRRRREIRRRGAAYFAKDALRK